MNEDAGMMIAIAAIYATPIAFLCYGELAARTHLPLPEFMESGSVTMIMTQAMTGIMLAGLSVLTLNGMIHGKADGIDKAIGLGVPGAAMAIAAALAIDAQLRRRRAKSEIESILRDDVPFRTGLKAKAVVTINRDLGVRVKISHPMSQGSQEAIEAAYLRHSARIRLTIEIVAHPLPASATLRAAITANGSDPMGPRAPKAYPQHDDHTVEPTSAHIQGKP